MAKKHSAVVFVHGLAKKPAPEKLIELWLMGISRDNPRPDVFAEPNKGINLATQGVPHEMNYYANVFYGEDYETDFTSYYEAELAGAEAELAADHLTDPMPLAAPQSMTPREREFIEKFEATIQSRIEVQPLEAAATESVSSALELASLIPAPLREAIIKKAAMEAYYFLFDKEYIRNDGMRFKVRQELRDRLLKNLHTAAASSDRTIVVSHSMGTIVAYDVLRNCPDCPPVDTLITLGSPLGIKEVQSELKANGASRVDFPAATTRRWINIYDPFDPICGADPRFANDFQSVNGKKVEDIRESNWGKWRHTITHYFAGTSFRMKLGEALGLEVV